MNFYIHSHINMYPFQLLVCCYGSMMHKEKCITCSTFHLTTRYVGGELPKSKNDIESRSNSPLPLQIVCEEHDTQSSNPDIIAKRDNLAAPLNSVENDSYVESGYSDVQGEDSDALTTPLVPSNEQFPSTETPGASLTSLTRRGRVYTRVPPGPHISLTGSTGNRVYLKMCTADELRLNVKKVIMGFSSECIIPHYTDVFQNIA